MSSSSQQYDQPVHLISDSVDTQEQYHTAPAHGYTLAPTHGYKFFIAHCVINNVSVTFELDSGAQISTISYTDACKDNAVITN